MYSQIIYYILVILIISACPENPGDFFSAAAAAGACLTLVALFAVVTQYRFARLTALAADAALSSMDRRFNRVMTQQTAAAIALLTFMLYGLGMPAYPSSESFLYRFPTFWAVGCMACFLGLMAVIWFFSHVPYTVIYHNALSFSAYVKSNTAFSLPVLVPWLMISVVTDFLANIRHEPFQRFFLSGPGELLFYLCFTVLVLTSGPLLIQRLWGCRPIEPGEERRRIETLCRGAGLSYTDILYWPIFGGKMITAGIMGFVRFSRYILVTPALMQILRQDEIDTVIAHEIGHVKKHHLVFYLFFLSGFLFFAYAAVETALFVMVLAGYAPLLTISTQPQASPLWTLFYVLLMAGGFILYFRFVFGYFMRNFERQADTYVFQLFDSAAPLIRAFEKIAYTSGIPAEKPNWHHYSIGERIRFLQQCEANRKVVLHHDRKVKKALAVFFLALILAGTLLYGVAGSHQAREMLARAHIAKLHQTILANSENPILYSTLGDLYLSLEDYENAISAYKSALMFNSALPHVMNNLAWIYITCPDKSLQNLPEGLVLAQKAAVLAPSPETLDTLSESYFANGNAAEAVVWGKKAIELARKKPEVYQQQMGYYQQQLEKFSRRTKQKKP